MVANYKKGSPFIVNYGGSYGYWKERIKKEWFSSMKYIEFEGYSFPIPEKYEEYLSFFYGDYLTPPPIEKRGDRHSIIKVDFGDYRIRNKWGEQAE